MPLSYSIILPQTKDDAEFERMTVDYFRKRGIDAYLYGRKGQKQYGIDIINENVANVVQCKNYINFSSDRQYKVILDSIIEKIKNEWKYPLQCMWIALGCYKDRNIQDYISNKQEAFEIKVLFWDDISEVIYQDIELLQKYYPQLCIDHNSNCEYAKDIKSQFNDLITKHNVIQFVNSDPTQVILYRLIEDIDEFFFDVQSLKMKNITCQNDAVYKQIDVFTNRLSEYSRFLGLNMETDDACLYARCYLRNPLDREEFVKGIRIRLSCIDIMFRKINPGMTIFV